MRPRAFVLGDRDLVVPVRAAGARVTLVSRRGSVSRFSRHVSDWVEEPGTDDLLVDALVSAASSADSPAVLFYQPDAGLLFASRHRDRLTPALRFVLPPPSLVEQLVDKAAFQELAEKYDLPVPNARVVPLSEWAQYVDDLPLPLVVKPLRRVGAWSDAHGAKAVLVSERRELRSVLSRLEGVHDSVIVQALVPGPESRIESYHVHVDANGEVRAEFTGRKLRTHPGAMGHSSAVVTTTAPDVIALGRDVLQRLDFVGVAKLDFKRDDSGRLWLLEINPRFNLWHHLGAAAGVNIPASVLAEVLDLPYPERVEARPGVTWCRLGRDLRAARGEGMPTTAWARWALAAGAYSTVDPSDPLPVLAGGVLALQGKARRRRR